MACLDHSPPPPLPFTHESLDFKAKIFLFFDTRFWLCCPTFGVRIALSTFAWFVLLHDVRSMQIIAVDM